MLQVASEMSNFLHSKLTFLEVGFDMTIHFAKCQEQFIKLGGASLQS